MFNMRNGVVPLILEDLYLIHKSDCTRDRFLCFFWDTHMSRKSFLAEVLSLKKTPTVLRVLPVFCVVLSKAFKRRE